MERIKLIFFSKKLVRSKKRDYLCAPLEWEFIDRLSEEMGENGERKFFKKTSKNPCEIKTKDVLLHPLRETH